MFGGRSTTSSGESLKSTSAGKWTRHTVSPGFQCRRANMRLASAGACESSKRKSGGLARFLVFFSGDPLLSTASGSKLTGTIDARQVLHSFHAEEGTRPTFPRHSGRGDFMPLH